MECSYNGDWTNGKCCCNCKNQLKLMKHPWNQNFGKGSISEQCGFVCIAGFEDNSNEGESIFFENGHGFCELYIKKE